MGAKFWMLLLLNFVLAITADFTAECPEECKCNWVRGNKQADCSDSTLQDIPKALSPEIQILNLSGNQLGEISHHAFENVGLINLKKLVLRSCKLQTIQKNGLNGLAIIIELDISNNNLTSLHVDTFKETSQIRSIVLNNNKIEKLDKGLFNNLAFLHNVDLSNNRIFQIEMGAFLNLPNLRNLILEGNKLEYLNTDTLRGLTSLYSVAVRNNPWRCDCDLKPFINWVISKDLMLLPVSCVEPPRLNGKYWKELNSGDFECKPNV